jgi:RNA polymerase sigma factor (sigma-70 family)
LRGMCRNIAARRYTRTHLAILNPSPHGSRRQFAQTRWSIIAAARDPQLGSAQRRAMEELARTYWPPLYAYLRRSGYPSPEAEDLTQAFFARLIERNDLRAVDAARGKFRSFVLASLKHFVANQRDRDQAQKRGGGVRILNLDRSEAESHAPLDIVDPRGLTPEREFHRKWALTVLHHVVDKLQGEYRTRNQLALFDALHGTLTGELTTGYADLAEKLQTTEGALHVAAHRMRKRYRELLRQEIAQTVSDPALVEEEMRDLLDSL